MAASSKVVEENAEEDRSNNKLVRAHSSGIPCYPLGGKAIVCRQKLYTSASPTVMEIIEGKIQVKMLIDSGNRMNFMIKGLWE